MKIKASCKGCYYSGHYIPNKHLAYCRCEDVTEPIVIQLDPLLGREERYVKRENWEDECNCEHFVPHLSEYNDDYELECVCTYETSFACPFCGETVDVWDLGIEETKIVTCDECGKQIAVDGKHI